MGSHAPHQPLTEPESDAPAPSATPAPGVTAGPGVTAAPGMMPAAAPAAVLALQRQAGNRAVAGLLARQPMEICRVDDTPETIAQKWGRNNKMLLVDRMKEGTISRAEVVAMARGWNFLLRDLDPGKTLEVIEQAAGLGIPIPEHRKKVDAAGLEAELSAGAKNAGLPEFKVEGKAGSVTLNSSGAAAVVKTAGGSVEAKVGPEGPEVSAKDKGGAGITAKAGWNGKKASVSIGDARSKFGFDANKEGEGDDAKWKWTLTLSIQVSGPAVTPPAELTKVVTDGQKAIGKLIDLVRNGLDPEAAKDEFEKVKSAIEALSSATKKNEEKAGVSIGGSVSGGGAAPLSGGVYLRFAFQ